MSREIMEQALEALEDSHQNINPERGFADELQEQISEAIASLRQALAQPEQEPVYAFRRKGLDDFCTCDKLRYEELASKPNLFEVAIFYTDPPVSDYHEGWEEGFKAGKELAQPEQTGIPEFPEPFTKADIEYAPHESWDDERERDWLDLQVCQRNKIRLHKYARQLRELLAQALAQPEPQPTLFYGRAVYFADPKTCDVKTQPDQDNIQYVFPDKPVAVLKDCEPKEVWIYVKGEWLKFNKEQA